MLLIISAIAPSAALLTYFYIMDRYEKEPRLMLFKAFAIGCLSVVPIIFLELKLNIFELKAKDLWAAGYTAFVVAGLVEEGFKFFLLRFLLWQNRNFNELYDGIIYSVFISLGFATAENIGYVYLSSYKTAFVRAITAVPAHALFGVIMGYYFGRARFAKNEQGRKSLLLALLVPILIHGIYDFILFSKIKALLMLFIPYMLFLWMRSLRHVDEFSKHSPFVFRRKQKHKS